MGRKKKKIEKPWCWYCNREFEDEKILTQHQKAKHFKCHICHKKLFSGPGLSIHCMQVHKETVTKVPYAIPGRDSTEITIFGMEGIPDGATRGRAAEDEEPAAKQSRFGAYATPPMPPTMGSQFGAPYQYPSMPPMPPGYGGYSQMPYAAPPMPYRGHYQHGGGPHSFGAFGGSGPVGPSRHDNNYGVESSSHRPPEPKAEENEYGYSQGDAGAYRSYVKDEPRETFDSPREELKSAPVPYPANSSKLSAKTRIMHPDDHSISLEERRAMMVMNAAPSSYR